MKQAVDFFRTIERFGANQAIIDPQRSISYAELAAEADHWAARIGPERALVFLECRNDAASIAAYLGCLRGDHVVHLFGDLDEARLASLVERYRPSIILRQVAGHLIAQPQAYERPALHPDLRVLLSTSGSTGSPKFVKLSERNLTANAASICDYLGLTAADRAVTSLKFHYSYGMSVINTHLAVGGALVLTDETVTSPAFWRLFESSAATSFAGVPYSFEMLALDESWATQPSLRYVTQAGGRLAPDLVRRFARLGARHGWDFFVMYGQTEAAPRMAWLPPHLAEAHAEAIGVPVPGGAFALIDEHGVEIEAANVSGELVYSGPNVMMGYAHSAADLQAGGTIDCLRTGDVAVRTNDGVYRIVGRAARMVKPFGLRLNLDEMQAQVRERLPGSVCAGNDELIVVAVRADTCGDPVQAASEIARLYRLPQFAVKVVPFAEIPLLPSAKPDYQGVLAAGVAAAVVNMPPPAALHRRLGHAVRTALSPDLYRRAVLEAKMMLGLAEPDWQDVRAIFATLASAPHACGEDSFESLAGDSLSYVQVSLALETYLGFLPQDWERLAIGELEALKQHEFV